MLIVFAKRTGTSCSRFPLSPGMSAAASIAVLASEDIHSYLITTTLVTGHQTNLTARITSSESTTTL